MLKSHELIGFMSPALALDIITWVHESERPLYDSTLSAVAEARKLRPVYFQRQPRAQRHNAMLATLARPSMEMVTANVLRTWLLKKYKSMLMEFLDALGLEHKEGVVENLPPAMDDQKLQAAIEMILTKYPPEVVAVYLNAFNEMNEVEWPNLNKMLETDKRIQLGG